MVLFLLLDSAQNSMIEATQAYGIEEASETESEAQVNQLSKHAFPFTHNSTNSYYKEATTKPQNIKVYVPKSQYCSVQEDMELRQ